MSRNNNKEVQTWFTLKEASDYLRLSTRSIMRAMASGRIRRNKVNGRYLLQREWLDAFACGFRTRLSLSEKKQFSELTMRVGK
jgi:excisionase family DNA binding protein